MNLYITREYGVQNKNNAGGKAPSDINRICRDLGWTEYKIKTCLSTGKFKKMFFAVPYLLQFRKILRMQADYILYQHPSYFSTKIDLMALSMMKRKSQAKLIFLIHDLDSIRFLNTRSDDELCLIEMSDYVICHNHRMKEYLVSKGVAAEKIVELELFDYLSNGGVGERRPVGNAKNVAIAGNLSPDKCGYIYQLMESNPSLKLELYGAGYSPLRNDSNVSYHGSFPPEELPSQLDTAFGLVWDGSEITTCAGNFGQYLRYNNPHKLSLYMAAGIPVITWTEAAIADFVEKNHVGIVVDSLINLSDVLNQISDVQYAEMKTNAQRIGKKLGDGFYFRRALQKIYDLEAAKSGDMS